MVDSQIIVHTRKARTIANDFSEDPASAEIIAVSNKLRAQYIAVRHRPTRPSHQYNCHGLTFASRRTRILHPDEVAKILIDDDYIRVDKPVAGDIAIYRSTLTGEIEHSGVVVEVQQLGPMVLSKWGTFHEAVHMFGDCPYDAKRMEFYRIEA